MLPTREDIERAAYDRWIRRDRAHGHDRDDWLGCENELTYLLNYQTLAEYSLHSPKATVVGKPGHCPFCERTARYTQFSAPRPVVQGVAGVSLVSAQVCDGCQADWRQPLDVHCERFWSAAAARGDAHRALLGGELDPLAVFKSLVTSALLIMPQNELGYFADALEWVSNPDHDLDRALFGDTLLHIYDAPFMADQPWASLARRSDEIALVPYMVLFVASGGIVVQVPVPLSARDQDLEGGSARMPVRSLVTGTGPHFREARRAVLSLSGGRSAAPAATA